MYIFNHKKKKHNKRFAVFFRKKNKFYHKLLYDAFFFVKVL